MFHVVLRQSGPEWKAGEPLEAQSGWQEHAVFMDALVEDGFIVLGGPIGNRTVVHVVEAASEEDVRARFAEDPWSGTHLVVESIDSWEIRLRGVAFDADDARRAGLAGTPPTL
jgi:hypothetical protein